MLQLLKSDMNTLFNNQPYDAWNRQEIRYQIESTADKCIIDIELPGVKKEEVLLNVESQTIVFEAKNKKRTWAEKFKVNSNYDVTKTVASLELGILRLEIPRNEESKPKRIELT